MEHANIEIEPSADFISGFNEGYFLAQEMPQFANDMAKHMPQSERGSGFGKGIEQFERDVVKEQTKNLEKNFKDNKADMGVDKNSRENLSKDFKDNKDDIGVTSKDKYTSWLTDKEENKLDMGIDRTPNKEKDNKDPELD